MKRVGWFVAARSAFAGFFLFTSIYCLLAYVPFTYQQIHKGGLLPWLGTFAWMHPILHWLMLGIVMFSMCVDRPAGARVTAPNRKLRLGFLVYLACSGLVMMTTLVLKRLENDIGSYIWSLLMLLPVIWLAAIDWSELPEKVEWAPATREEQWPMFQAAWQSALFLALLYTALVYPRGSGIDWSLPEGLFAAGWSAASHLLALMLVFVLLNLLTAVAGWFSRPPKIQFLFCHLLGAMVLWAVFRSIVFGGISFTGWKANLYAVCFSFSVTAYLSGLCLRLYQRQGGTVDSGLSFSFWFSAHELERTVARPWVRAALALAGLASITFVLAVETSKMDWNYLLQKLAVLLTWLLAFRLFYRYAFLRKAVRSGTGLCLLAALGTLAGYRTLQANQRHLFVSARKGVTSIQFLERYSGYDASFKLIRDALSPSQSSDPNFYRFLTQNTNIPRSVQVDPVPINLVEQFAPRGPEQPNIFIITIDSLRRDYLSPYNSLVDFTPEVEKFGRESCVFENAFSHYGGTGLSEPSIWVGGMLLHKQYVTPFSPMNTLEKLLQAEQYRAFISRDTILQTVVTPWKGMAELDENRATMNYDLCSSLEELEGRLGAGTPASSPVFAYTQPQNIHISVMNREGGKPVSGENYRQFYAPYASRLRRMDGCFGKFIRFLKERGLYDKSILVLTADHGDSLGEEGRWGHAYTIYPEIIRIPLIIHLPPALRQKYYFNPKLVTFSTDITPSLYYLLGHRPVKKHEFLGRPLFTERAEEQGPYRQEHYLIASSYGAVYGILSGDGRQLYVSDAVNYKDYVFDLSGFSSSGAPASTSMKAEYEELIREKLQQLAKFYGFAAVE